MAWQSHGKDAPYNYSCLTTDVKQTDDENNVDGIRPGSTLIVVKASDSTYTEWMFYQGVWLPN